MKIVLKISDRCNLECRYCYCTKGRRRSGGSARSIRSISSETQKLLAGSGPGSSHQIVFFGGEPLFRFGDMVRIHDVLKSSSPELSFSVVTNGTLLDERICDWLVQNGVNTGISIDGASRDHDFYRKYPSGKGSYGDIQKNLLDFQKRHPEGFSKLVSARMTVSPSNVARLFENVRHLENMGFGAVGFAVNSIFGRWTRRHLELLEESAIRTAEEHLKNRDLIRIPEFELIRAGKRSGCRPGIDTITIDSRGRKFVCHRSSGMVSVLEKPVCSSCAARDFCTRCTARMGMDRPNQACRVKLALKPAFEMLQYGAGSSGELKNEINRREQAVDRLIEIKGKLYRVPQEVLDRYRVEGSKKEIAQEIAGATKGRAEPPIKGNWYELGESDCF